MTTIINHEALPDWAIELALKPVNTACSAMRAFSVAQVRYPGNLTNTFRQSILAHAALIFKHQKKPVDPLLEEAREICALDAERSYLPDAARMFRAGDNDHYHLVCAVLAALRRGVEIGKGRA